MIEEAIAKLTAAVNRNNELLEAVLASAGSTPAPVEEPKPAPAKKKALVEVKKPEPVEETPSAEKAAAAVEAEEAEEPKFTIVQVIDAAKKFLGADRDKNKPRLDALRDKFGVDTVKDLAPEQINTFMAELAAL